MQNRANETVFGTDGTAHANTPVASETISSGSGTNTQANLLGQTTGTVSDATAATAGTNTLATHDASLGGSTPTVDHAVTSVAPPTAATAGTNSLATHDASLGGSMLTTDHAATSVAPSIAATAGATTPATAGTNSLATHDASLGGSMLTTDHAATSVAPSTAASDLSAGTSAPLNTVKLAALLDSQGHIFVFDTNTNLHQGTADVHAAQDAIDLAAVLKEVGSMEQALADHTGNLVAHAIDTAAVSPSHDSTAGTPAVTLDDLLPQQSHSSDLFFH
jgi:hypothetical protein